MLSCMLASPGLEGLQRALVSQLLHPPRSVWVASLPSTRLRLNLQQRAGSGLT